MVEQASLHDMHGSLVDRALLVNASSPHLATVAPSRLPCLRGLQHTLGVQGWRKCEPQGLKAVNGSQSHTVTLFPPVAPSKLWGQQGEPVLQPNTQHGGGSLPKWPAQLESHTKP